jgi:hypothetical protein
MDDDGAFISHPTRIGGRGSIILYGKRSSFFPLHCLVGSDWPISIFVLVLIIVYNAIVLPFVYKYMRWEFLLVGILGFICLLFSYSFVAFSDPGIVFRKVRNENSDTALNVVIPYSDIPTRENRLECGQCEIE